jgi:hypothetical protein
MDKPRISRFGKLTKVQITLAGGVIVIMLGTMAIVNGFWPDKINILTANIRRFTQNTSMNTNHGYKEVDDKPLSSFATKGKPSQQPKKLPLDTLEKQVAPKAENNDDFGEAGEKPSHLRGDREPTKPPSPLPRSSGADPLASAPLPNGFGHIKIEDEISHNIKKEQPKLPPSTGETRHETPGRPEPATVVANQRENPENSQKTFPPSQPGEAPMSSPQSPAQPQVSSASKLVVQAGANLTRIVGRNYPENPKMGMVAVILANSAIASEDEIHPGQRLSLPEINFTKQTIRLENNLLYALYGVYLSTADLKDDTAWLAKKKVHFIVRDTLDSRGNSMHRVFLGGYATEEGLEEARGDVKTR